MKSWHRFYDPSTGRYISADPIGLAGGMNLYAYVGNDPVNWVDPWGLITKRGPWYYVNDDGTRGKRVPSAYEQYKEAAKNYENAIDAYLEAAAPIKEFVEYYDSVMQEINARNALGNESACVVNCIFTDYPLLIPGAVAESVVITGATLWSGGEAALLIATVDFASSSWTVFQFYEAIKDCRQRCKCNE